MTLRAVVFDYYGTLAPGRTVAAQVTSRRAQADALGVDAERFDAELTATVDARFRGAGGDVPGSLRWIAARLGVSPSEAAVASAADVRLAAERRFGEPRADAVDVLRAVKQRGLLVGVVSDCSAELPAYFETLPIAPYVDAAVLSFLTGCRKPEPENYLACCAALGVEPGDCLYVGDGGSNELAGARSVGMRAVHLAVSDELAALVYGRHLDWDGEVVNSLADVLTLMGP